MMGLWDYKCPKCGWEAEVWGEAWNDSQTCRQCEAAMDRDYRGYGRVVDNTTNNAREIHSDSLAILPDQVAEHHARYPDVPLDSACRPVFTSVKQREKYLEGRGVVKISHNKEY